MGCRSNLWECFYYSLLSFLIVKDENFKISAKLIEGCREFLSNTSCDGSLLECCSGIVSIFCGYWEDVIDCEVTVALVSEGTTELSLLVLHILLLLPSSFSNVLIHYNIHDYFHFYFSCKLTMLCHVLWKLISSQMLIERLQIGQLTFDFRSVIAKQIEKRILFLKKCTLLWTLSMILRILLQE